MIGGSGSGSGSGSCGSNGVNSICGGRGNESGVGIVGGTGGISAGSGVGAGGSGADIGGEPSAQAGQQSGGQGAERLYLADGQGFEWLYRDELPGASHWSFRVKAGHVLRLTDLQGGANVGMLFYNPADLLERYNVPDTLKCQHTFRITAGHCLYSDMGRIFCSVIADTVGWHDTVCGNTSRALTAQRWGMKTYQQARNERTQNGYDSFLVEAAKYGMGRRDLAANLNWFSRVDVDESGHLRHMAGNSRPGDYVDLRFEMDTLVLLHTCPHPLNMAAEFPRRPIAYAFYRAGPVAEDDLCRNACVENRRGFQNTSLYNLMRA